MCKKFFAKQLLVEVGIYSKELSLSHHPPPKHETSIVRQSYRIALSFLLFWHHKYGEENIQSMVKQVIRAPTTTTFEEVVSLTYGKTLSNLEAEWITAVKKAMSYRNSRRF